MNSRRPLLAFTLLLLGTSALHAQPTPQPAPAQPPVKAPETVIPSTQSIAPLIQDEKWAEARPKLEKILAARPKDGLAWFFMGYCQLMEKQYDDAVKSFTTSADLGVDRSNSLYNIACAYSLSKQSDKAFEYLEKAVAAGFDQFDHARTDADLANIRSDPRFEKALKPKAAYAPSPDAKAITFSAADGVKVNAELYPAKRGKSAPIVLLFHQARSNGAEYQTVAPKLNSLGYNALAVDARSGGTMFGRDNLTVKGVGKSADYPDAYPDIEAALAYVKSEGYTGKVIAVGSSYSTGHVFHLAAEHPEVAAILLFSPGRPGPGPWKLEEWGKKIAAPVFMTASPTEAGALKEFFGTLPQKGKVFYEQKEGVHGASTLRDDKNPKGAEENFKAVAEFLKANAPA